MRSGGAGRLPREGLGALGAALFARAKPVVDTAWTIVTGEDLRYPSVAGRRPLGFDLLGRYMDRVQHAASFDRTVLRSFFEVATFVSPPHTLFAPNIVARLALAGLRAKPGLPHHKAFAEDSALDAAPVTVGPISTAP